MKIIEGEKYLAATVFIVSENKPHKFLLVHHKKLNVWLPPGGHIEKFENPLEAAVREVREETNVDIKHFLDEIQPLDMQAKLLPLPLFMAEEKIAAHGGHPMHYHIDMIYLVLVPEQTVERQVEESYDIGWFDKSDIAGLEVFANVRHEIEVIYKKLKK